LLPELTNTGQFMLPDMYIDCRELISQVFILLNNEANNH